MLPGHYSPPESQTPIEDEARFEECVEFEKRLRSDALALAVTTYKDAQGVISHESALEDAWAYASDFVGDAIGEPATWRDYCVAYDIDCAPTKEQIMGAL